MSGLIDAINPGQWVILGTILTACMTALGLYFKHRPDQTRADTEALVASNADVVLRFKEFREEVHGYKNEVMRLQGELAQVRRQLSAALDTSARRGDKLNMLRFILSMLIDELAAKDPKNKVLAQARAMLSRIDDEPHQLDGSDTLHKAEDAHAATGEVINEIKKQEATE